MQKGIQFPYFLKRSSPIYLSEVLISRNFIDEFPHGVMVFDSEAQILLYNQTMSRWFGKDENQALGKHIEDIFPTLPHLTERFRMKRLRAKKTALSFEMELPLHNEELARIRVWCCPVFNGQQLVTATLACFFQLPDKEDGGQIVCLENGFSRQHPLSNPYSDYLAYVSHELRNPINALACAVELLQKTSLSTEQQEYVETLRSCSATILSLTTGVLDLAKIESGQMELTNTCFNLHTLIHETLDIFTYITRQKGIDLRNEFFCDESLVVYGDGVKVRQILVNLLNNAIKFTEHGHVILYTCAESVTHQRIHIRFEVRDTGIGIAQSSLAKIFDAFSQVHSTKRDYGGTGLGLKICRSLTTLLGGSIGVNSEEGRGSTFFLNLPFDIVTTQSNIPQVASGSANEGYTRTNPARVLLVEDNELNRLVARRMLECLGFEVTEASNGKIALEILKGESRFSVILMDCELPELDGYSTTQELRASQIPALNSVPVVAMTAHALLGDREKCLSSGMNDYIVKPLSMMKLKSALDRWTLNTVQN